MKRQNMAEKVLSLSAEWGYTVFYRNCEESNVLCDIFVAHPTSIAMIKTWPYELIIDTTYKTNKYNMPLLKAVGITLTRKNFTVNEHSVLKLWLSTCHGDLDTVFLNIDSLIKGQIAKIKTSLEISKLKEKYGVKMNPILKNISNIISHLALKKIWLEIKRVDEISGDPQSMCGHYLRKSHGFSCACELVGRGNKYESSIESQGSASSYRRCYKPGVARLSLCSIDNPSETAVTKGRRKTNSTKRDKSYWEHVSIAHRKIGKSSGSRSDSRSSSSLGSGPSIRGRGRPPCSGRGRGRGRNSGRSSLSFVINPDDPSMPFPFRGVFPWFVYEFIQNWKNMVGDGNWSTTVLPLYSNVDCIAGTLCIGFISDQKHFIQLHMLDGCPLPPMHVGWVDHYYERIVEWIRISHTSNPTQGSTHVVIP
ncbi:hypothetical protein M9H77_35077 [Catharanthus roseus]|uniref:Uncharacterized protein n=1 Tax=Catharanthus roseus TaxID=4058 RepID=A0ACB9ZMZ8_CATRO|nr:hypothetical protein M9H77_35077 [Catharanthus roseus]